MNYEVFFKEIGISENDHLIISSDIRQILAYQKRINSNIQLPDLLTALAKLNFRNGSVIIPTFTWEFCNKNYYDIKNTSSALGALANIALKDSFFTRTKHPIYSFAVAGKISKELCDLTNVSGWGADSPFARLSDIDAVNIFIGIDYKNAFTFDHFAEEMANVEYRSMKIFTGRYVDYFGNSSIQSYSMFVRNTLENKYTRLTDKFDDFLVKKSLLAKYQINGISFQVVRLKRVVEYMIEDLKSSRQFVIYT